MNHELLIQKLQSRLIRSLNLSRCICTMLKLSIIPKLIQQCIKCVNFPFICQLCLGVIIFDSVQFLLKKNNQIEFFVLKKKTKTELKPVQTDRIRFGLVFQDKNQFKPVWLGFSSLAQFGSVFFYFRFGFGSVWCFRFNRVSALG